MGGQASSLVIVMLYQHHSRPLFEVTTMGLSMVMHRNNGMACGNVAVASFTYVKEAQKTKKVVYLHTAALIWLASRNGASSIFCVPTALLPTDIRHTRLHVLYNDSRFERSVLKLR